MAHLSLSLSLSLAEEADIGSRGSRNFNASMPIPAALSLSPSVRSLEAEEPPDNLR